MEYELNDPRAGGRAPGRSSSTLRQQSATNDAEIRARQTRQSAAPGQAVGNGLSGRVGASEAEAKGKIEKGRNQVAQGAGTLSEGYKSSVRVRKISPNHGGNRAVWDTVGANATQPNIGTPPKVEVIGEWHFGKDGVPVMGPPPNPETTPKPGNAEAEGRSLVDCND